jgi:hypothetical protein
MTMLISTVLQTAAATPTQETGGLAGVAGLITGVTGLVTAGAGLLAAWRSGRRAAPATAAAGQATETAAAATAAAVAANNRASAAANLADKLANAHQDGVVLVLAYPFAPMPCRALLEANGWQVAYYAITRAELDRGDFLPGSHIVRDIAAADAIVIEGLDAAGASRLSAVRDLRDNVLCGTSVVLYTGGLNHRYDLTLWGDVDQATNMPVTTEAAVRASLARRAVVARRQGIRPGQVAAARAALTAPTRKE